MGKEWELIGCEDYTAPGTGREWELTGVYAAQSVAGLRGQRAPLSLIPATADTEHAPVGSVSHLCWGWDWELSSGRTGGETEGEKQCWDQGETQWGTSARTGEEI